MGSCPFGRIEGRGMKTDPVYEDVYDDDDGDVGTDTVQAFLMTSVLYFL